MADIFISYAREDRQWVEQLANQLQTEGFSVWWDWDLLVGKRYRETIDNELQTCRAAVVVWSQHSVQSDFVRDEAEEAQQRNILVPVLKEIVRPPAGFRQIQTADLSTWRGSGEHAEFRRVMKGIAHMVGRPAAGDTGEVHVDPANPSVHFEASPTPAAPEPSPAVAPIRRSEPPPPKAPSASQSISALAPSILANLPAKNHPIWRYLAFGVVGLLAILLVISQFETTSTTPTAKPTINNGNTNAGGNTGGNTGGTTGGSGNASPPPNTGGVTDDGNGPDIGQTGPHPAAGSDGGHAGTDNSDTGGTAGGSGDSGDVGQSH